MEIKSKSKLPEILKLNFDLGKFLNYPFNLFFYQALSTPFERLQVLKQCQPRIQQLYKNEHYLAKLDLKKTQNLNFKYQDLAKGKIKSYNSNRKIRIIQRHANQRCKNSC